MMNGFPDFMSGAEPAPVLVLGLGNTLLSDDGFGPALLEYLAKSENRWGGQVEFLDGGTQGLALLGHLSGRKSLIIVDALRTGAPPGTVQRLTLPELRELSPGRASSGHESNVGELLAAAQLLDELPGRLFVIGVEPEQCTTGVGLSACVSAALPEALTLATALLEEETQQGVSLADSDASELRRI